MKSNRRRKAVGEGRLLKTVNEALIALYSHCRFRTTASSQFRVIGGVSLFTQLTALCTSIDIFSVQKTLHVNV